MEVHKVGEMIGLTWQDKRKIDRLSKIQMKTCTNWNILLMFRSCLHFYIDHVV